MRTKHERGGVARWLGLPSKAEALVSWDVFDAVLTPGDTILLMSWYGQLEAEAFEKTVPLQEGARPTSRTCSARLRNV